MSEREITEKMTIERHHQLCVWKRLQQAYKAADWKLCLIILTHETMDAVATYMQEFDPAVRIASVSPLELHPCILYGVLFPDTDRMNACIRSILTNPLKSITISNHAFILDPHRVSPVPPAAAGKEPEYEKMMSEAMIHSLWGQTMGLDPQIKACNAVLLISDRGYENIVNAACRFGVLANCACEAIDGHPLIGYLVAYKASRDARDFLRGANECGHGQILLWGCVLADHPIFQIEKSTDEKNTFSQKLRSSVENLVSEAMLRSFWAEIVDAHPKAEARNTVLFISERSLQAVTDAAKCFGPIEHITLKRVKDTNRIVYAVVFEDRRDALDFLKGGDLSLYGRVLIRGWILADHPDFPAMKNKIAKATKAPSHTERSETNAALPDLIYDDVDRPDRRAGTVEFLKRLKQLHVQTVQKEEHAMFNPDAEPEFQVRVYDLGSVIRGDAISRMYVNRAKVQVNDGYVSLYALTFEIAKQLLAEFREAGWVVILYVLIEGAWYQVLESARNANPSRSKVEDLD